VDIRCPRCAEPWDLDSLHEVVADGDFPDFNAARKAFTSKGCGVAFASWGVRCEADTTGRSAIISALAALAGDDVDGFASDLEDAEYLGLLA
jgi:hypothetical protein